MASSNSLPTLDYVSSVNKKIVLVSGEHPKSFETLCRSSYGSAFALSPKARNTKWKGILSQHSIDFQLNTVQLSSMVVEESGTSILKHHYSLVYKASVGFLLQ